MRNKTEKIDKDKESEMKNKTEEIDNDKESEVKIEYHSLLYIYLKWEQRYCTKENISKRI